MGRSLVVMMMPGQGAMTAWMALWFVIAVAVLVALVILIIRLVPPVRRDQDDPHELLRRRFATGEIDEEEFTSRRAGLEQAPATRPRKRG